MSFISPKHFLYNNASSDSWICSIFKSCLNNKWVKIYSLIIDTKANEHSFQYLEFSCQVSQRREPSALLFHLSLNGKSCESEKCIYWLIHNIRKKFKLWQTRKSKRTYIPSDPTCIDLRISSFWSSFKEFQASWHSLLFSSFSLLSTSKALFVSASSFFWNSHSAWNLPKSPFTSDSPLS